MLDNQMIRVGEAKGCCSTPLLDLTKWVLFNLRPVILAIGLRNPALVLPSATLSVFLYIVEKMITKYVQNSCYERAVARITPIDKRITVASATESPTGSRVRKRTGAVLPETFVPGGGQFGGGGAGAQWEETLIPLDFTGGNRLYARSRNFEQETVVRELWVDPVTGQEVWLRPDRAWEGTERKMVSYGLYSGVEGPTGFLPDDRSGLRVENLNNLGRPI